MNEFTIGDRVYYVLPRSPRNHRPTMVLLTARLINITAKRFVIQIHGEQGVRVVSKSGVCAMSAPVPKGAVIK